MLGMDLGADGVPAQVADEIGPKRIERSHAAVDVEIALLSRGQSEGAGTDGFLEQQFLERRGNVEHGRRLDTKLSTSNLEFQKNLGGCVRYLNNG